MAAPLASPQPRWKVLEQSPAAQVVAAPRRLQYTQATFLQRFTSRTTSTSLGSGEAPGRVRRPEENFRHSWWQCTLGAGRLN